MRFLLYQTTNTINGKIYIGSHMTEDLEDDYLGSGTVLKRALLKYGRENFKREILFEFSNAEAMFEKEAELVNASFVARADTYNLKIGGFGGWDHINSSDKKSEICRKAGVNSFRNNSEKVRQTIARVNDSYDVEKRRKAATKNRALCNWKGKTHSDLTRQKMSFVKKGKKTGAANHMFGTCWITDGVRNKKIQALDLSIWENQGWKKGRIMSLWQSGR